MAKKDELIAVAKSLSIETEGLTVAQLEKAISEKETAEDNNTNAKSEKASSSEEKAPILKIEFNADTIKETLETATELGIDTKGISFDDVVTAIATKKESIEKEAKAKEIATAKEMEKAFEYDGKFFGLSDLTPKTLKVLDTVYTQEELLQNKEAMEFLIVGRSCFVKRLK